MSQGILVPTSSQRTLNPVVDISAILYRSNLDDRSVLAALSRCVTYTDYSIWRTRLIKVVDQDAAGTILTKCKDGSYCCFAGNTECCDQGGGTKIDKKGQIIPKGQITSSIADSASTSSVTGSSSTSSSTASHQTAAPATTTNPTLPSPNTTPSSGLSGGAKAGIAIGCVAGAALIASLLFLLFRERRKSRAMQTTPGDKPYAGNWQNVPMIDSQLPAQEMSTYNTKYQLRGELDGQSKPQELDN
ncbi:MAG: hypothetical protein Q9181_008095 [Wetmoreana brouardii]